jgi:5-oxopent-3-ene-1,2,5-tricarboxylate decarboxylase/2-hydroxyhepta-2,4-diene-1,7-dioate isomerase
MISGTAYGAILNDRAQLESNADAFTHDPYKAPPKAPVLYIKPRSCFSFGGASVALSASIRDVEIAATVAVLFARDVLRGHRGQVRDSIGAACLALDLSEPHSSVYRPAVRQRCRNGFLPLGAFAAMPARFGDIVTLIDGKEAHRWSLSRLARTVEDLIVDVSAYMTLRAGDLLLVGLPGDAPTAGVGREITVRSEGLPDLATRLVPETAL